MSNWIRDSTKRRRVGPPKPRSQRTRVFNAQGIVSHPYNMETERMGKIVFDLKHARDANERVETFQQLKRTARPLGSEESARTSDPLPPKEKQSSKALAALDRLQRDDPAARRVRILQCVDLVGLNTGITWKPKKHPSQISPAGSQPDKSKEITNRTNLPVRLALPSVHSRSESESCAQETTESVDSPARVPPTHALTPTNQQSILAIPFSQDEILSMDFTFSQSQISNGSYEQENASLSDSLEHATSATVDHSSPLFGDTDGISIAENDYMGQSDYLRATPPLEDEEWGEGEQSTVEDMYQQPDEIPPLYPIIYDRLGFPIVDRLLEYRLRLPGDRSGVGWPLKRWRGDETDLLADETIDIGVPLELDGLSSLLWRETTTNSRGTCSRCPSTTDHSSPFHRFGALRGPSTTFSASAVATTMGSPDTAFEDEYVQEEEVFPLAYQLVNGDVAIPDGDALEDDIEEVRSSPQNESVALSHQGPRQSTGGYLAQCSELAFDCSQESTLEAVVLESELGDMEMEEAVETEQMFHGDENGSDARIESAQESIRGFALAPDLFGD